MKPITLFLFAFAGLVAACHKPLEPTIVSITTSDTTFNLSNTTPRDLQVAIYNSPDDLLYFSRGMVSCLVPANDVYKIPVRQIDTAGTTLYYYHFSTPDHHYTNWGSYPYFWAGALFRDAKTVIVNGARLTQASWYFLHDNEQSTQWIAIDRRRSDNVSVWSSLQPWQQYFRMTIGRNQKLAVTFRQSNGELVTDIKENIDNDTLAYPGVTKLTFYNSVSQYELYNITDAPGASLPVHTSRDTIFVISGSDYWLMKRL